MLGLLLTDRYGYYCLANLIAILGFKCHGKQKYTLIGSNIESYVKY